MKSALEANQEFVKANSQTPPTYKDVLLKTWAQDTEAMAKVLVLEEHEWSRTRYFYHDADGDYVETDSEKSAIKGEIAYLNSAAEVGK